MTDGDGTPPQIATSLRMIAQPFTDKAMAQSPVQVMIMIWEVTDGIKGITINLDGGRAAKEEGLFKEDDLVIKIGSQVHILLNDLKSKPLSIYTKTGQTPTTQSLKHHQGNMPLLISYQPINTLLITLVCLVACIYLFTLYKVYGCHRQWPISMNKSKLQLCHWCPSTQRSLGPHPRPYQTSASSLDGRPVQPLTKSLEHSKWLRGQTAS